MNPQNNNAAFDKNVIWITLLVIGVWFLWNKHLQTKYPAYFEAQKQNTVEQVTTTTKNNQAMPTESKIENIENIGNDTNVGSTTKNVVEGNDLEEHFIAIKFDKFSTSIANIGMGLLPITINSYTDREKQRVKLALNSGRRNFELGQSTGDKRIHFQLKKLSETVVVGRAKTETYEVERKYEFDPETYSVQQSTFIKSLNNKSLPDFITYFSEELKKDEGGSFFAPSIITQELLVIHNGDNEEREMFSKNDHPFEDGEEFSKVKLLSIGSHYFASAYLDDSSVFPRFKSITESGFVKPRLTYSSPAGVKEVRINSKMFFGPKKIDILTKVDPKFENVVAFGMFSSLAKPLLDLLKWFHSLVQNYGFAIILLTLLVRMAVLPFNIMSYKSMTKMKEVQPQLQAIREKYKDDPVRSQQETYAIFKEHKVNPLGGCLPMLLQFPIFIALYQVLGQSIELYQAPFMFWIDDLSLKDPFYVLPVLMGITMFIQMKITPQAMDPQQAKIMSILPIFFTFIMLALPSGLTLYIFVSTLFGIIQQFVFMKDKTKVAAVAKA